MADQSRMREVTQQVMREPHNPAPRCEAAEILLRNGQPQEARRWLDSALKEDPRCQPALRLMADLRKVTRE